MSGKKVILCLSSSSLRIWFKVCGNNADTVQVGLERWGRSNPAYRGNPRMQSSVARGDIINTEKQSWKR